MDDWLAAGWLLAGCTVKGNDWLRDAVSRSRLLTSTAYPTRGASLASRRRRCYEIYS